MVLYLQKDVKTNTVTSQFKQLVQTYNAGLGNDGIF